MELTIQPEILESTTFGNASKRRVSGLLDVSMSHEGYFQANAAVPQVDDVLSDNFAVPDAIVTICPTTGAAGEKAFSVKSILGEYNRGGQVGELMPFTISGQGSGSILIRGTVMENGAKSSSGNGTARQLGAVGAAQKLYAVLHVLAVSGTNPTLDVTVESDDAEAFIDPTTRITFTRATDVGAEWATPVGGGITDTWWRLSWTIGGSDNPSFTIAGVIAIQ